MLVIMELAESYYSWGPHLGREDERGASVVGDFL
jgi:hypothetical protein